MPVYAPQHEGPLAPPLVGTEPDMFGSPLAWAEELLIDPKTGLPFDANFLQREILQPPKRRTVIRVHRRAGKTYSFLILCLYWAMILEKGELIFIAPRMAQVEKFWDDLDQFIDEHPFLKESVAKSGNTRGPYKKTFTNGTILRGFTTGGGTDSVRGQGADVVFLDEVAFMQDSDFKAITPIINGDKRRRFKPIVYAASTPAGAFGKFFRMCRQEKKIWHEIFLPIDKNPEYTNADRVEIESTCSSREWETEYLCKFLDAGMNVFPLSLIERAMRGSPYQIRPRIRDAVEIEGQKPVKRVWRTMGVDWDKFNADGSGPTIAIVEVDERPHIGRGIPTVIYRQSIKQGPQCLTEATARVIQLNELFEPDKIFADGGLGEMQIEVLHAYGQKNPYSKLATRVERVKFGGNIVIHDPVTKKPVKNPYKAFMVNLLSKWLEDDMLIFPATDLVFKEQLTGYRIKNQTFNTVTYTKENEHIIDAVGMACVGMFQIHKSPFRLNVSNAAVMMPGPERMASGELTDAERRLFNRTSPALAKVLTATRDDVHDRMINTGSGFAVELEKPAEEKPATKSAAFAASLRRNLSTRFSSSSVQKTHRTRI